MDQSVEEDTGIGIPVEYFALSNRELKLIDDERDAFHKYSEARQSYGILKVVAMFSIPLAIYAFIMALLHAKSWYFFVAIAIGSVIIRNPMVLFVLYIKSKLVSGVRTPFIVHSAAWIPFIQNMVSVMSSIAFGLFLLARMLNGPCVSLDQYHRYSCSSEHSADALPQEHMLGLMLLPIAVSSLLKTVKTPFIVFTWVVSVSCIALCIGVFKAYQSIPALVVYIPLSVAILYENHRENLILFKVLRKQQALLKDIRVLSEEAQTELRFMIANMAHDLKTPLSAFMNGVETIQSVLAEVEKIGPVSAPHLKQTQEGLKNLQTVNNFMVMTVNRCIDYMKASKGIKLEPRLETINLQEVLSMPLNCMRDLQSRITINQNPFPPNVCSHIITDLQWFQENLFCLISNAVKYSSRGYISVSLLLVSDSDSRIAARSENLNNDCLLPFDGKRFNIPVNSGAAASNDYSYLDKLAAGDITRNNSMLPGASTSDEYVDVETGELLMGHDHEETQTRHPMETSGVFFKKTYLLVEVEDTGIGLSDEVKETLFKPFKQAQRRAGGTGLGLYSLAKRVDALGGYYGVSNRRDGEQGSIFWFAIPYRCDEAMSHIDTTRLSYQSNSDSSATMVSQEHSSVLVSEPSGYVSQQTVAYNEKDAEPSKLRILLVDDSLTILKMTSNLLRRHGHVVDQEENGADALKALERSRSSGVAYDIVLLDLNMPVMDGLEAMKRLREVEKQLSESSGGHVGGVSYHQKVFAFTANSDNESRQEALDAGADDFISKPFSIQTFNEKIARLSNS